ncbi:MAG TPA: plastocyanin/azurin family copper-binding protein [Candidatus Limnocylindria bacterium]|nr:plastocyanin/azurin family copper-binding protein [Candidatus Limnocylindria bacterium]
MGSRFGRRGSLVLAAAVAVASLLAVTANRLTVEPARAERTGSGPHAGHDHPMTDEQMRQQVIDWMATHPRRGSPVRPEGTPAATFTASGFTFDADGSGATPVDTVVIDAGESVLWTWVDGFHTVTNGTGSVDPNAGQLFNADLSDLSPSFEFVFTNAGTFPFFCGPHEGFNMKGAVVVQSTTGVTPLPSAVAQIGFTAHPAPNPTAAGVRFRFALGESGRTRLVVFDARGRRVATIVDDHLAAGSYAGRWDGRGTGGPVGSGIYFLRLSGPGIRESQRVTVAR